MVRHHYRVASAIALTLALAVAAPASARLELSPATGPVNQTRAPGERHVPPTILATSAGSAAVTPRIVATRGGAVRVAPRTPTTPVGARHVTATTAASSNHGFHWSDAGIGAGGAVALMTLVVGGALGASSVRRRTTRSPA
jgi:hypothetical protein